MNATINLRSTYGGNRVVHLPETEGSKTPLCGAWAGRRGFHSTRSLHSCQRCHKKAGHPSPTETSK